MLGALVATGRWASEICEGKGPTTSNAGIAAAIAIRDMIMVICAWGRRTEQKAAR
jgi:hypothetical protein